MARCKASAAAAAKAKAPSPAAAATAPAAEPVAMSWSRRDDKLLEMLLLCQFPRWDLLGNKTPEQVAQRYDRMVDEVTRALHATHVETPREWDVVVAAVAPPEAEGEEAVVLPTPPADVINVVSVSAGEDQAAAAAEAVREKALVPTPSAADGEASGRVAKMTRKGTRERKKPEAWTRQEHNLFLKGLEKYGKGKWKLMASEYLKTKTASQIASHHQKYRNRLEKRKRNACKRASIHDITQPTTVVAGEPPGAQKDDHGRGGVDERPKAPPGDDERGPAVESAEPTSDGGNDGPVGAAEEFPGEDDPGTLFTY